MKLGKHVSERYKHTAGTVQQRTEDLHTMLADDEVKAIICTIGGLNSNQLNVLLEFVLAGEDGAIYLLRIFTVLGNDEGHKTGGKRINHPDISKGTTQAGYPHSHACRQILWLRRVTPCDTEVPRNPIER